MSKQHFIAFARYIAGTKGRLSPETRLALVEMVVLVATQFPGNFQVGRFKAACDIQDEERAQRAEEAIGQ
jgi:hypothetical protein